MEAFRLNGSIAPHILNLDTSWNESSASRPGRFTRAEWDLSTHWRRSGPQRCFGLSGQEIPYPDSDSNHGFSDHTLASMLSELSPAPKATLKAGESCLPFSPTSV
jgi:hypothetical protein